MEHYRALSAASRHSGGLCPSSPLYQHTRNAALLSASHAANQRAVSAVPSSRSSGRLFADSANVKYRLSRGPDRSTEAQRNIKQDISMFNNALIKFEAASSDRRLPLSKNRNKLYNESIQIKEHSAANYENVSPVKKSKKSKSATSLNLKNRHVKLLETNKVDGNLINEKIRVMKGNDDEYTPKIGKAINNSANPPTNSLKVPGYIARQIAKSRATSVPHWFYGSKAKDHISTIVAAKSNDFRSENSVKITSSNCFHFKDKHDEIDEAITRNDKQSDDDNEETLNNKWTGENDAGRNGVNETGDGKSFDDLYEANSSHSDEDKPINNQKIARHVNSSLPKIAHTNNEDELSPGLSPEFVFEGRAFPDDMKEIVKPEPRCSLQVLRTLPLQSDLDKYLHYLQASKRRSGQFTLSFHRYVLGMEGRVGGPISRPYKATAGVMERQKTRYGQEALSNHATSSTVQNLVGQTERIKAGQERLKTQLKDGVLRTSSGNTSVHSKAASNLTA